MSYVHELCLVKWLLSKNIRHCELCKKKFSIREEIGSPFEILKEILNQTLKSKKRVISAAIYTVYLYLLGKRLLIVTKYFARIFVKALISSIKTYIRLAVAEVKLISKLFTIPF